MRTIIAIVVVALHAGCGRDPAPPLPDALTSESLKVAPPPAPPAETRPPAPLSHAAEIERRKEVCRRGELCARDGRCSYIENSLGWIESFDPSEECVAVSLSECVTSTRCKVLGWCSLDEFSNRCLIGPGDCAKSQHCKDRGLCRRGESSGPSADGLGHACTK